MADQMTYLIQTADEKATVVEADNAMVDEQGVLNLWLDRVLVAAFGRGFWVSAVQQEKADG